MADTTDTHAFDQLIGTWVSVCRCGLWPDHHVHTGDHLLCGCDQCRSTRGVEGDISNPEGG